MAFLRFAVASLVLLAVANAHAAELICDDIQKCVNTTGESCDEVGCQHPFFYCAVADNMTQPNSTEQNNVTSEQKTCQAAPKIGEQCTIGSEGAKFCFDPEATFLTLDNFECAPNGTEMGDNTTGICQYKGHLPGLWCCDADSQCISGTCENQECAAADVCDPDALDGRSGCNWNEYCKETLETPECRPVVKIDEECYADKQCAGIAVCSVGVCSLPFSRALEMPCEPEATGLSVCESGWCDIELKQCAQPPEFMVMNETCSQGTCGPDFIELELFTVSHLIRDCVCVTEGENMTSGNVTEGNMTAGNMTEGNMTEGNMTVTATARCTHNNRFVRQQLARATCNQEVNDLKNCSTENPQCPLGWRAFECCCEESIALAECMSAELESFKMMLPEECDAPEILTFPSNEVCQQLPKCNISTADE